MLCAPRALSRASPACPGYLGIGRVAPPRSHLPPPASPGRVSPSPSPLARCQVAVTTVRSPARWQQARRGGARSPLPAGVRGRWAGPGRGQSRRRARQRLGEDGSPRDPELSYPARGGEGAPEEGEPRCSSRSPTPFPRRHNDPSERRPRGRRGWAAQGGGKRRAATVSCIHQQPGIQGTARTCPKRTQTLSLSLSTFVSSQLALARGAEMCP